MAKKINEIEFPCKEMSAACKNSFKLLKLNYQINIKSLKLK